MKKRNKILIGCSAMFIIVAFVIVLYSMYYYKTKMNEISYKQSLVEEKKNEIIEEYENKDQFIGINNCFLGIVSKEGDWFSANKFYTENRVSSLGDTVKINVNKKEFIADDIVENGHFYFYDELKGLGKKSNIFYDKDLNPEYYGEIYYFRFNAYDLLKEEEDESKRYDNSLLFTTSKVLSSNYSNRIKVIDKSEYVNYEKYVQKILNEKNIKSEVDINKVLIADRDGNEQEEIYILSNSRYNAKDDNVEKGIYSFVLKVENENINIILENTIDDTKIKTAKYIDKCFRISGFSLVDFNNDGKLEIVIEEVGWDIPEIYVIRLNESNEEELCLYGNFAW